MVSLHGFSILILLTQSNHKSALLFSCTCPFSGACGYYTTFFLKSQTYVHIFSRKIKNFSEISTIPKGKGRDTKQKYAAALQRKPARREEKGDPQAGQRGRLFAAGLSAAACFSCFARLGTAVLCTVCAGVCFGLFLGVSLSAAARSAAALVYDKLTPNCHPCFI